MQKKTPVRYRPTIHTRVLKDILSQVNVTPEQQDALLESEGLSSADIFTFSEAIPLNSYMRIFDRLSELTGTPQLGLKISKAMGPDLIGAIGYVFLCSPNLGQGLEHFTGYIQSIQDATEIVLKHGENVSIQYVMSDDSIGPRRQDVEFSLGYVYSLIQRYLDQTLQLKEVYFEHGCPLDTIEVYERFFNCPVFFEQDMNALVLDPADLKRGSTKFDTNLIPILMDYINNVSMLTFRPETLTTSVEHILGGSIASGMARERANIHHVAKRLGMSDITLRRRLKEDGTNFRDILRRKRIQIAKRNLDESMLSMLQIADKSGFTETASFTRAFIKETGTSPSQYRKSGTKPKS